MVKWPPDSGKLTVPDHIPSPSESSKGKASCPPTNPPPTYIPSAETLPVIKSVDTLNVTL